MSNKTCREWIRKKLNCEFSGKEFEVRLNSKENQKDTHKADMLWKNGTDVVVIEDKESGDVGIEKAVKQVEEYCLMIYKKFPDVKNIVSIAVKELENGEHIVKVFKNGSLLENEKRNDLNSLEYYFNLMKIQFNKDILIQNIKELNEIMHSFNVPDNIRASIASTFLVCINTTTFENNNNIFEINNSDDIKTIKAKVDKALHKYCKTSDGEEDLNKWKKIVTLYDRLSLDLQKEVMLLTVDRLVKIYQFIKTKIFEYIKNVNTKGYDIMSLFFTTFSRYALSNDKGQFFTPDHISDLMTDLLDLSEKSVVLDSTCGSGTFLAKCMDKMIKLAKNNEEQIKSIKQNQIYGIEKDPDVFGLAVANMLLHRDGKSNIENADCFDYLPKLKNKKINRLIMNPPYSLKDSKPELTFLYESLNILEPDGIGVIIVPTSCALGTKWSDERYQLMQKHQLMAVFTCNPELFYPTGVNTCIMVWKAHHPHEGQTYLADWKDDKHKKVRLGKGNTVRVADEEEWKECKNKWINSYSKKENGILVELTDEDSWLYESHLDVDYSDLKEDDFVQTVRKYLAFKIESGL